MHLKTYLDGLPRGGSIDFAKKIDIHPVYLSQLARRHGDRSAGPELCVVIERATNGVVSRQDLRPDDYWLIWPDLQAPTQEAQGA